MRRIYNFSDFSKVYETEVPETDQSKFYDTTLNQIITSIINNYIATTFYAVPPYSSDQIEEDINFVLSAPAERKIERIKEILSEIQEKAKDNTNQEEVKIAQAFVSAANKAVEALEALMDQYQDDREEVEYMAAVIDSRMEEFLEEKERRENSSLIWEEGGLIRESIKEMLGTKEGMMDTIEMKISIVNDTLGGLAKVPGMTTSITTLQNEVRRISQRMGALRRSKKKDIEKKELNSILDRLSKIPQEAKLISQKIAKQDTINGKAAVILLQSLELAEEANDMEDKYLEAKRRQSQMEEEARRREEEEERKKLIKVSTAETVEYDPSKIGTVNPIVKEVQKLIIDNCGKIPEIAELPQYIEFARFGSDGKFGERTKEIVKIVQILLGYEDPTGNISPSFVEKLQTQDFTKIDESQSYSRSIQKFSSFSLLLEDGGLKLKAAIEYAKKQPSYRKEYTRSSSGGSSSGSSEENWRSPDEGKDKTDSPDETLSSSDYSGTIKGNSNDLVNSEGYKSIKTIFPRAIEIPYKTHPRKDSIANGADKILTVSTNNGFLDFFRYKPGGYWNQQNFVTQTTEDGKSRLGTFDIGKEKIYFKKFGTPKNQWYSDEGFNQVYKFSSFK